MSIILLDVRPTSFSSRVPSLMNGNIGGGSGDSMSSNRGLTVLLYTGNRALKPTEVSVCKREAVVGCASQPAFMLEMDNFSRLMGPHHTHNVAGGMNGSHPINYEEGAQPL